MDAAPAAGTSAGSSGAHNLTRVSVLADELEIADTLWARFMGLMGRKSLPPGRGLWLTGNGIHMFFMRFSIDAVFLGRPSAEGDRPVLSIHRRVRPWIGLVPFVRGADGVLELPVGTIDASATARGDRVRLG
jgi:uncharacterized membrane protein (UPF0127 family)